MYLNKNITGMASGVEYGRRGDKISIVPTDKFSEMVLVENNGQRFYV